MKLKWVQLESSAINAVAYNRERKVLHVEFRQGVIYSYPDIGKRRYYNLIHAKSVGKYFNEAIKPRKVVEHDRTSGNDRSVDRGFSIDLTGPGVGFRTRTEGKEGA